MEWVDYHMVRCAVELGAADAQMMMENFILAYPSSVHANRMHFMLGSYLCDEEAHRGVCECGEKGIAEKNMFIR